MKARKLGEIDSVVLHCSDSDIKAHDNIETITSWHVDGNGWEDIGYNYVITNNGDKFYGRSLFFKGAHAKGYNTRSIGICLTGRDKFSIAQELSLFNLLIDICKEHEIKKIYYHNEVTSGKTCPNFKWGWIERLNEAIQAKEINN